MTEDTIWDVVKNHQGEGGFTEAENWGEAKNISGFTLWLLKVLRVETGWPIIIHKYAVEYTGHSKKSQHYKKTAADWHFVTATPFKQQVLTVLAILQRYQLADFVGLGIYPFWNNKGFHTDTRGEKARWGYGPAGTVISFEEALEKWA